MPIFEYRCTACGERFEALVSRADLATPHCPRCGAARAERLISTF
ncbi:MAG: zinc ribbon domain-containing protein, partial [Candidatus Eisenbacteria bacterium]